MSCDPFAVFVSVSFCIAYLPALALVLVFPRLWCFALPLPYRFIHSCTCLDSLIILHPSLTPPCSLPLTHSLSLTPSYSLPLTSSLPLTRYLPYIPPPLPPPPHHHQPLSINPLHVYLEARGRDAKGPRAHCCRRCCCDMEPLWTLDSGLAWLLPIVEYIMRS